MGVLTLHPHIPQLCLSHPLDVVFPWMENTTIFIPEQWNNNTKCIGSWNCQRGCYKWMGSSCQNHLISKCFFHIVKRRGSFWYRVSSFDNVAFQLINVSNVAEQWAAVQKIRLHSRRSLCCLCFRGFVSSGFLASAVVGSILSAHLVKWVTTFNPDWKDQFLLNNWKLPEPIP